MKNQSVIISSARTPIGSFQGSLSTVPAVKLGAIAIKEVIHKSNIDGKYVDEVIMGNVLSASIGQAPARQAALLSGLPKSVECMTINKVCGSGLKAVMLADQAIRCGDAEIIIAGGMENMSKAPYYSLDARKGMRMGHGKIIDSLIYDGLWDPYNDMHMGNCAEVLNKEKNITKESQDLFAINSYKNSLNAIENNYFDSEIAPVEIIDKKGNKIVVSIDEEPGKGNIEKIKKLSSVFDKNGTITAANASSINDGAAALMLTSIQKADQFNVLPICRIIAHASVAHDPLYFTTAPSKAIAKVLNKTNYSIEDIDLFEINEAFSNVVISAIKEHSIMEEKVNIFGGAVSLGHPIGASGARILVTLISALKNKNKKIGLATLCIGGGEAAAVMIEMI